MEVWPGSEISLMLNHDGRLDTAPPTLSIQGHPLQQHPGANVKTLPRIYQDAALQMLRILEPAYASPSTMHPELSQAERNMATLHISLQGKVMAPSVTKACAGMGGLVYYGNV